MSRTRRIGEATAQPFGADDERHEHGSECEVDPAFGGDLGSDRHDTRRWCENEKEQRAGESQPGEPHPRNDRCRGDPREKNEARNAAEVANGVGAVIERQLGRPEGELQIVRDRPALAVEVLVPADPEVESDGVGARAARNRKCERDERQDQRRVEQRAPAFGVPGLLP